MRWRSVAVVVVLVAGVATARLTVFDPARVSSGSMAPTVCTGDVVIVNHLAPGRGLQVDDIITFPSPTDGTEQIKRVVAVGGQQVAVEDAQLPRGQPRRTFTNPPVMHQSSRPAPRT